MKRFLWILTPLILTAALIYIAQDHFFPKFEKWALAKLHTYSTTELPVVITAKALRFRAVPPRLSVEEIEITPQTQDLNFLELIKIDSLDFRLDFLQLLGGRLSVSTVFLHNPKVKMDLAKFEKKEEPTPLIPIEEVFKTLDLIPIREILVQGLNFELLESKQKASLKIESTDVSILLLSSLIDLRLKTGPIQLGYKGNFTQIPFQASTHSRLEPQRLLVEDFVVASEKSQINFQGSSKDPKTLLKNPQASVRTHVRAHLPEIQMFLQDLFPNQSIPVVEGEVKTTGRLETAGFENIRGETTLATSNIKIGKFIFGDLRSGAHYENKKLVFSQLQLKNQAGQVEVSDAAISLAQGYEFDAKVKTQKLDLRKLLASLGLEVPVDSQISTLLNCSGGLSPSPYVKCQGEGDVENSKLFTESHGKATNLLSLSKAKITGYVTVDSKAVKYNADLQVGENKGKSDGVISYDDGFFINYQTPRLDFANISNLFNLKFEGWTAVHGSTQGDSNSATATMNLSGENLWFENYLLSKMSTDLEYKAGHVTLDNVKGTVNNSQYQGKIVVDLTKNRLKVNAQTPFFEVRDILSIFSRRVQLPFEVTGTGNAHVDVEGPFAFNELSYVLRSAVYRGTVAGDSFDKAFFDVTSKNGEVVADRVEIHKRDSILTLRGVGHPDGNIDTLIEGKKFRLEESENVSKISSSIIGLLNFRMSLSGYVLEPDTNLKGTLSEVAIEDQILPNSAFAIKIGKETIEGSANIIGNRVQSDFVWPLTPTAPFKMKVRTLDWNFASFFGILTGSTFKDEYRAALTSQIDLEAPAGGILKSTGEIHVNRVFLRRGQIGLQNNAPIKLTMQNGVASIENLKLAGDQSVLTITGKNFTANNLNFSVNGRTDLRLLQIFTPFLEDLGGPMSLSLKVTGPLEKPEVLGSAFAQEAFIKLKGFPHAFEKMKADVLFSHTKILINSVRAQLAGGILNADGVIEIKGLKNFDTKVRIHAEGANLNLPEGIRSTGKADLMFSGSWFPFVLSGTYSIANGLFEKEFEEDKTAGGEIKQSMYLPKVILQDGFDPVIMDLTVVLGDNMRIKNSLVDGKATGVLRVQGPPTAPSLTGTISTVAPTNAIFRDKVFEILTANLNFTNPSEIDPELYISARSRIKEYDVNLLVQGTVRNQKLRLTSEPPLPEADLISLLALGVTGTALEKGIQGKEQETQTAYQLGAAVLTNTPLNREIQQRLGVELQFTSDFDEARGVAVPKFTLTRKLSPKMSAQASRSFGGQTSNDVKLNYQLSPSVLAIGSYEATETAEGGSLGEKKNSQILGLDLEYRLEFK
ncbi:MAG: translocation/assembly module TamB domain-containing protein [Pseudobdellovibrionaceae bacterium]